MKKTLVLLAIIISGCLSAYSQPLKQFSKDSQTFLNELSTMFQAVSSSEQKDLGKALMVDFTDMWLNKFDAQEKDSIYTMCNVMLKRKMKTYPNFEQYLRAAINFHRANLPPESFESWQFCLRNLAKMTNNLRFMALLEGTNLLLTKNYLYESKLSLWKSNSKDFVFKYDSLPYFEFPSLDLTCVKKTTAPVFTGLTENSFRHWTGGLAKTACCIGTA